MARNSKPSEPLVPDNPIPPTPTPISDLPPPAQRALAEAAARRAAERRAAEREMALPPELGGRDGPEPVRFGDWEKKGIAIDF